MHFLKLTEKLNKLINNIVSQVNTATVKNISDKNLDQHEISVLSDGFNFALNHTKRGILQYIAQIEPAIEDIREVT